MKKEQNINEKLNFEKIWLLFQETDRQFKETANQFKETDKKILKLQQNISGIGNNIGEVTEDYFYSALSTTLEVGDVKYNYVDRNVTYKTKKRQAEYDIVLINDTRLLVIEIKHKLHPSDVEKFAKINLPLFKNLFPEYSTYNIYGAVAGMTIPDKSKEKAEQYGLLVITQSQTDNNITVLNNRDFQAREY